MMNTLRSEWRKLISVRMWIGLAIAAVLFTGINAAVLVVLSGTDIQGTPLPPLTDPAALRSLYGSAGQASVFALILGILAITSEYRHQTITSTLLATPHRGRLVAAKMAASALLGAAIGLVCMAATLAILGIGMMVKDIGPIAWGDLAAIAAGVGLGFAVYAVLGVGFGSLVRNQIAAITAALVWVLLIESLVVSFWPTVGRWLPGGALSGVLQAESFAGGAYLSVLPATVLLLAYAAVFALIASRITMRRDIT